MSSQTKACAGLGAGHVGDLLLDRSVFDRVRHFLGLQLTTKFADGHARWARDVTR
jgi:hypothetical protein